MNEKDKELLIITMEECSEVAIECSKILRFGFTEDKEKRINLEVGDLMCMFQLMQERGYLSADKVEKATRNKKRRLKRWSSLLD